MIEEMTYAAKLVGLVFSEDFMVIYDKQFNLLIVTNFPE